MPNYLAFAVPFFLAAIAVEAVVARRRGLRVYRLDDAVIDLACGMTQQLGLLVFGLALLSGYTWLYDHARVATLPPLAGWLVAFVGFDFLYYWWHRWSHEVNLLWAVHLVHHSSEDYNLAVALRQAVFSTLTEWPLNILLALVGVTPLQFVVASSVNLVYQFWVHTELIERIGRAELLLNAPAHHRVHHAVNPRYLDKNYAGIFILWDRLFGTFVEETEQPVYGLVDPLRRFDAMWAQVHHLLDIARLSWAAPTLSGKLLVWVKRPAWRPAGLAALPPPPEVTRAAQQKYVPPGRRATPYVLANLALAVLGTTALMLWGNALPFAERCGLVTLALLTLAGFGGFYERRAWALPLELGRLALCVGAAGAWAWRSGGSAWLAAGAALLLAVALAAWAARTWTAAAPQAVPA